MIRFKFIEDHHTEFSVKRMCTVLKVRRSSYYKWAANTARREQQVYADGLLGERIRIAFEAEGGLYGAKRIAALLTAQTPDQPVNHKRVARVMKMLGLAGFTKKRRVRTTVSDPHRRVFDDLLGRDFTAARPNEKLVGDITYLPLAGQKNMYLATVIDCFSRKLVGFAIADHMRVELVEEALLMAAGQRGSLRGAIFHSDHGSVYTSSVFQETCRQLGVQQSMGAVGSSADNALAESFNATLKREVLRDAKVFPNMLSCRRQVFAWCARYNTKRLHTWCKYQAPDTFEHHASATLDLAA